MKELTLLEEYELSGGTKLAALVIYVLIKAGIYKVLNSSSGKIFIPKIISAEWKSH